MAAPSFGLKAKQPIQQDDDDYDDFEHQIAADGNNNNAMAMIAKGRQDSDDLEEPIDRSADYGQKPNLSKKQQL